MIARSHVELRQIRKGVERIRTISDRVIGIGPFGIGLDAILSWIPGVGALYSGVAGLMLLVEGVRARASVGTLIKMASLLGIDTLLDIPGFNPITTAADTLFTGHKWSANLLLKHMDETIYIEGTRETVKARPEYIDLMARVRAGKEKRRIIFLG